MAFDKTNLTVFADSVKSGYAPVLWSFYNEAGDTITAAGYLTKGCGVKAGDKVLNITATPANLPTWYYASVSSGVITLTACS